MTLCHWWRTTAVVVTMRARKNPLKQNSLRRSVDVAIYFKYINNIIINRLVRNKINVTMKSIVL